MTFTQEPSRRSTKATGTLWYRHVGGACSTSPAGAMPLPPDRWRQTPVTGSASPSSPAMRAIGVVLRRLTAWLTARSPLRSQVLGKITDSAVPDRPRLGAELLVIRLAVGERLRYRG